MFIESSVCHLNTTSFSCLPAYKSQSAAGMYHKILLWSRQCYVVDWPGMLKGVERYGVLRCSLPFRYSVTWSGILMWEALRPTPKVKQHSGQCVVGFVHIFNVHPEILWILFLNSDPYFFQLKPSSEKRMNLLQVIVVFAANRGFPWTIF